MHKIYKNKWKKAESLPFLCTQTWGLALAHLHSYLSEGRQVFGGDKMNNLAVVLLCHAAGTAAPNSAVCQLGPPYRSVLTAEVQVKG